LTSSLLFLDFDGVLNSSPFLRAQSKAKVYTETGAIDPSAVAKVNRIIAATGAKVVVSSSWRIGRDAKAMQKLLEKVGFIGEVIGTTPDLMTLSDPNDPLSKRAYIGHVRGDEIQAWLTDRERLDASGTVFVIIDDYDDMAHLRHRLVQTSFDTGLTDTDVDRAIAVLNGP